MLKQRFSNITATQQLILLVIVTLSSWMIFSIIGIFLGTLFLGISPFNNPSELLNNIPFLKYFQTIQSLGLFIIPPFLFTAIYQGNSNSWLLLNKKLSFPYIIFAILIVIISQPLISFAGVFNNGIEFPNYLQNISEWMRQKELEAQGITEIFLVSSTTTQTIVNIIIIAILPAIGEELLFRGAIQRILNKLFKNVHVAIFITAILFSAMHIQFFGFLPRFLLGMIFGYLVVYGDNLWLSIIGHFTNNFMAYTLYQHHLKNATPNPLTMDQEYPSVIYTIVSTALVVLIIWFIKKRKFGNNSTYLMNDI